MHTVHKVKSYCLISCRAYVQAFTYVRIQQSTKEEEKKKLSTLPFAMVVPEAA